MKLHSLSKLNLYLVIINILIWSAYLRIYPTVTYHPIPGSWAVWLIYPIEYIVKYGHIISINPNIITTSYTYGIYTGLDDITRNVYPAIILIIMGFTTIDQYTIYHRFYLIEGLVIFPFAILSLYSYLNKNKGKLDYVEIILIYLLAVFGNWLTIKWTSFSLISETTGMEWTFMIFIFYSLLRYKESPVFPFLYVFFTVTTITIHRPAALFLLCIMISMLIFKLILKDKQLRRYELSTIYLPIILIISYYIFISNNFFDFMVKVTLDLSSFFDHRSSVFSSYLINTSSSYLIYRVINIILSQIPILIFMYYFIRKRYSLIGGEKVSSCVSGWIASIVIFSIGIFAWAGLQGIYSRTNVYSFLVSMIVFIVILTSPDKTKYLKLIKYLLLISVIMSIFTFSPPSEPKTDKLTYSEFSSLNWISRNINQNSTIFSEYRIVTPLILYDFFKLIGVEDVGDPNKTIKYLETLYYKENTEEAVKSLNEINIKGESINYIYLSRRLADEKLGIHCNTYVFKSAAQNFTDKFDTPELNLVYNNDIGIIYTRV